MKGKEFFLKNNKWQLQIFLTDIHIVENKVNLHLSLFSDAFPNIFRKLSSWFPFSDAFPNIFQKLFSSI